MLRASLFRCKPDEAEIQMWYIERKQYDFIVYNRTDPEAIKLTRENDIWSNMESGTRIIMRALSEEVIVDSTVTATYKCPCGRRNTVNVDLGDIDSIWRHGCAITW
jgi:lysyl-tRNA synthetase class I